MQGPEAELLDTLIEDLVGRWPEVAPVFWRHRMLCVGCPMARFDTVRDAAAIYGIPAQVLAQELLEIINREASSA